VSDLKVDGIIASTGTNTNLTLQGKGTGKVAIGDGALLFPDADGSANQVIETNASGVLSFVTLPSAGFTLGTEQATTSGASINFTSIPSTAKMIIVSLVGVSLSAEDDIQIQIGDSGGLETSSYVGGCDEVRAGTNEATEDSTDSFLIIRNNPTVQACSAVAILTLEDSSDNTWMCLSQGYNSSGSKFHQAFGTKALSATLDRLSLVAGSGAFDAGVANISYM